MLHRLVPGRHLAAGSGGIVKQIVGGDPIAFHRQHRRGASGCSRDREESRACIQIGHAARDRHVVHNVCHQAAQQIAVTLKKREYVPPQCQAGGLDSQRVGDIGRRGQTRD